MINLFHIPTYKIDTAKFSSLLHDKIVREFEDRFAEYVGAKYAVSFNSATSAIYILFKHFISPTTIKIPSIIPPVVPNALINADHEIDFVDGTGWVGSAYLLFQNQEYTIIDSAQAVYKNEYGEQRNKKAAFVYSFYPTKPVGAPDGGMIVSDNKDLIERLRILSFNGMSQEKNNWDRRVSEVGHKMYMNSISAYIANENLKKLGWKKEKLHYVREFYNKHLGIPADYNQRSEHLYRVPVVSNREFLKAALKEGITCGIHYEAAHKMPVYGQTHKILPASDYAASTMVSLPFHEKLTQRDMKSVIRLIKEKFNLVEW